MNALVLPFDLPPRGPRPACGAPPGDPACGRALGREHARLGLRLAADLGLPGHPVGEGFRAACAAGLVGTGRADLVARHGLALRLEAWRQGQPVDPLGLGRAALAPRLGGRCPVTRRPLAGLGPEAAPLVALRADAWLAPGHLVQLDAVAARALQGRDLDALDAAAQQARRAAERGAPAGELDAAAWARLADLRSYVTPLPHARALRPMRAMPPPRLWLLNPAQGLQAWLMDNAGRPGAAARLAALAEALPRGLPRAGLHRLGLRLAARLLDPSHAGDPEAARLRLEDGAADAGLASAWQDWAGALGEAGCAALLDRALAQGPGRWRQRPDAVEAWGLAGPGTDAAATARPAPATRAPATRAPAALDGGAGRPAAGPGGGAGAVGRRPARAGAGARPRRAMPGRTAAWGSAGLLPFE